jgi:hypothetical protein
MPEGRHAGITSVASLDVPPDLSEGNTEGINAKHWRAPTQRSSSCSSRGVGSAQYLLARWIIMTNL